VISIEHGEGVPPVIKPTPESGAQPIRRWRWVLHLCILGAYPLVIGGLAFFGEAGNQPALSDTVPGVLWVSAIELSIFAAVFGLAWGCSRADKSSLYLAELFRWRMIPYGLGYSVALRIAIAIVAAVIAGALIAMRVLSTDQLQDFVAANRPDVEALVDVDALRQNPLYMIVNATLISFVVAGFREELWRAGLLAGLAALWPGRFSGVRGQILGVGIAAVIFGLGHATQGMLAVFLTGALGFLLGGIMVLHRSLWPAVLAHGFFNATTFVVLPWALEHLPELLR